ncbi:MAG: hypothetical protein CMF57_12705 [Leifsonia sp.]|nr:hypothetical protein [Leifsonia sp.]
MKFAEVAYRDCGWCRTVNVSMQIVWSDRKVKDAKNQTHYWAALACPRCGRVTTVEMSMHGEVNTGNATIHPTAVVEVMTVLPRSDEFGISVSHLPPDIAGFFGDAQRALIAGLPDAAAVQLRKTLEAAAAKKGVEERNLVTAVKRLLEGGHLTQDFSGLLDHIRKIGNIGAHYTDATLSVSEVERSLRFTTQVLRNLFEVPGELEALAEEAAVASETETGGAPPKPPTSMRV